MAEGITPDLSAPRLTYAAGQHLVAQTIAKRASYAPVWTLDGSLLLGNTHILPRLSRIAKPGIPAFDPSADAWFASANGSIVRIENDSLVVVANGVQGVDIDVRAEVGIAVSREPNDTIVLHRLPSEGALPDRPNATVLLTGRGFFYPRFSPDGTTILVSESHQDGSRFWITTLDGAARVVAQGNHPSWHPNGRSIVFVRTQDDGHVLLSSEVWMVDVASGEERMVGQAPFPATHPTISHDGSMIAFADGRGGALYWAAFDSSFVRGGR